MGAVVGAAVGGGTGATVGGTTGGVGGGAAGYYGYKHKDDIRDTISATSTKVKEYHGYAEQKVKETAKSIGEGYTSIRGKAHKLSALCLSVLLIFQKVLDFRHGPFSSV